MRRQKEIDKTSQLDRTLQKDMVIFFPLGAW
jgi:hypothetical protein